MKLLTVAAASASSFVPAPREYRGNMCGVRVDGLPPVPGGAADASLVVSWLYDRYGDTERARIRAAWKAKGFLDVLLSWPDSRASGQTRGQFAATCQELVADGFRTCVFWCSKDVDAPDPSAILAQIDAVTALALAGAPGALVGGLGRYTWGIHLDVRPRVEGHLAQWDYRGREGNA